MMLSFCLFWPIFQGLLLLVLGEGFLPKKFPSFPAAPRFQTLDLKHCGVLSPKELARLAWAMEPNWDFEDENFENGLGERLG